MFDLMLECTLLRRHVEQGKVALGINHELRDYRNNKKKNLDLVLCRATDAPARGGSKSGARKATEFAALVGVYGIRLVASETLRLAALPRMPIAGVSTVLLATEAKAAMTAFLKARPRLKDELTSSHQTIHGDNQHAIAAGLVLINAASNFVSPDLNKHDLRLQPANVSVHRQPRDAEKVIEGLRDLQRRATVNDAGFDGMGVVVIDCPNDGGPIRHVTAHPPAPAVTDDFDYSRFIQRIAHLYTGRYAEL